MTPEMKSSILATVKAEGYREGVGQAGMVCYGEAYYKGQCDARAEAPSRLRWWLYGAFGGYAIAQVVGAFL